MAENNDSVGGYLTPTQGWRVYGPSSRTMAKMMRTQSNMDLLEKAASLTPDYGKVIEGIQKYNVDPVTARWFENEANNKMQGYLDKYRSNPFYAFSREGRETVTSLQRLANDPRLQYAQNAYEMSKKEYEKHGEELQTINYGDGTVMVIDRSTGKAKRKDAFDLDLEKDIPLTGQDEFQALTTRKGFFDGSEPFKVRVSKPSELRTRLHAEFNDSGYLKSQVDDIATKTNQPNINKKLVSLIEDAGLSQQDQNTINGQYIAAAINRGEKPTKEGARKYMIKYLKEVADYKTFVETDADLTGTGKSGTTGGADKGTPANVGHYEGLFQGEFGATTTRAIDIPNPATGKVEKVTASGVSDNAFWDDYKEEGLMVGRLPLDSNPIFNSFVTVQQELTDSKGVPLDRKKVIPYGTEATIINIGGKPMLQFDAFVHEDAANTSISGQPISSEDEYALENTFNYYDEVFDRDPRFAKPKTSWFGNPFHEDWLKVTVQVPVDAQYAQGQVRNRLDRNPYYNTKSAYNIGLGGNQGQQRPVYTGN